MGKENNVKKLVEGMIQGEKNPIPLPKSLLSTEKEKRLYTEEDMEAAFTGGGANAAKFRISGNKLTLPCYEFPEWLTRYNDKKEK